VTVNANNNNKTKQVVKVLWHKTASPPQTDGSIVFARWRQCAIPCMHIGATWWIWLNLCFLRPTESTTQRANRSVQLFLHSWPQKVPILYNGRPFLTKLPLLMGSGPHQIHDSLGHSEITIQTAWRSILPFSHRWPHSVPILYSGRPFPQKLALPMAI